MSGWRTHIVSSAAAISLLVAELAVGETRGASSRRLQGDALASAEAEARAAAAPLADGKVDVDRTQAFEVSDGTTRVRIVPVRYLPRVPGKLRNVDYCALVIKAANRPPATVQTIGVGYTETVGCTGLDGIGFGDLDGDGSFDIALIYSTLAPPDRERKTPVVVRRDAGGTFAVDNALGSALDAQGGITTIARLRSAAARLTRTPAP
jgi:hypothetical protein